MYWAEHIYRTENERKYCRLRYSLRFECFLELSDTELCPDICQPIVSACCKYYFDPSMLQCRA
jgi:hypothetical protein